MSAPAPETQIIPHNPEYIQDQQKLLERIRVVPMDSIPDPLQKIVTNTPHAEGEVMKERAENGDTIQCTSFGNEIFAVQRYGRSGNVRGLPPDAQIVSDSWLVDIKTKKAFRVNQIYEKHPAVADRGASCEIVYIKGIPMSTYYHTDRGGVLVLTHASDHPVVRGQNIDTKLRQHITVHDIFSPFHEGDHGTWKLRDSQSKGNMKLRHMMLVNTLGSIAWSISPLRKLLMFVPGIQAHVKNRMPEELAMEKSASEFALRLGDKLHELGVNVYRAVSRTQVEESLKEFMESHVAKYAH